jgi:hypothetical protein
MGFPGQRESPGPGVHSQPELTDVEEPADTRHPWAWLVPEASATSAPVPPPCRLGAAAQSGRLPAVRVIRHPILRVLPFTSHRASAIHDVSLRFLRLFHSITGNNQIVALAGQG